MDRGLTQIALARALDVDQWTLLNWERDRTRPLPGHMGRISQFLGYLPIPVEADLPSRIRVARLWLGLSQEALAKQLGVDASTVQGWERGRKRPFQRMVNLFEELIAQSSLRIASGELNTRRESGFAATQVQQPCHGFLPPMASSWNSLALGSPSIAAGAACVEGRLGRRLRASEVRDVLV